MTVYDDIQIDASFVGYGHDLIDAEASYLKAIWAYKTAAKRDHKPAAINALGQCVERAEAVNTVRVSLWNRARVILEEHYNA